VPEANPYPVPHGEPAGNLWPGWRLGRPEEGRGSVARPGRRIAAIAIDFGLCAIISWVFFFGEEFASILIFATEQIVLLITLGGGVGHIIMGLRLVTLQGDHCGVWRPILRTALLCLLIPAFIWDRDQRGLHDVFSGTVLVRR
jgi:uncharacterized RDD family membrane protein YckC